MKNNSPFLILVFVAANTAFTTTLDAQSHQLWTGSSDSKSGISADDYHKKDGSHAIRFYTQINYLLMDSSGTNTLGLSKPKFEIGGHETNIQRYTFYDFFTNGILAQFSSRLNHTGKPGITISDPIPTESNRIYLNGLVGIGTDSPQSMLDVNGDLHIAGDHRNIFFDNFLTLQSQLQRTTIEIDKDINFETNEGNFFFSDRGAGKVVCIRDGNLAIGTMSPQSALDVRGNSSLSGNLSLITPSGSPLVFRSTMFTDEGGLEITTGDSDEVPATRMAIHGRQDYPNIDFLTGPANDEQITLHINGQGNIGIGTTNPTARLEVVGETKLHGNVTFHPADGDLAITSGRLAGSYAMELNTVDAEKVLTPRVVIKGNTNTPNVEFYSGANGEETLTMLVAGNGLVGIGTDDPQHKLQVEGTIRGQGLLIKSNTDNSSGLVPGTVATISGAVHISKQNVIPTAFNTTKYGNEYVLWVEEGIVTEDLAIVNASTWADHVFDSTNELMPLAEVKLFIQENEHLPDIPSAEDVRQNGYSVHDMNTRLLEKVEELFLYSIEQDEKIKLLEEKLGELEQRVGSSVIQQH